MSVTESEGQIRDDSLYTASRVCDIILATTGTGGAVHNSIIVKGGERNTTCWGLLSKKL